MAKKNKETGLTDREQLFVLEYLKDLNITQASIRAGYSKKTAQQIGSENLGKPLIQAFLKKELEKKFDKVGKDGDRVIERLVELTERCMQKVPVMYFDKIDKEYKQREEEDEDGKMQGLWTFDSSGANSALEKLGKYHKLFTDKVEHSGQGGGPLDIVVKIVENKNK